MPEQPRHLANKYEDIVNLQGRRYIVAAVHLQLVHCYIQKGSEEADGITTSPQICCHTTLRYVSGQLYSFTAQLI